MYNLNKKQYIFKQSSGKVWNFFFDEKSGICYTSLTKRNSWTEPVSLQKNLHSLFFADLDSDDCFHLLFQNAQGNIIYASMDNGTSKTYPILNSKAPQCYNKHLHLIPQKNTVHFFYTLRHNSSIILGHQTFSNGSVSTPKVVDYITESEHPYSLAADKSGNIYAFYQSSDGKYFQIGYRKFNIAQKLWGDFSSITKYSGDVEFPHTIIDNKNIIHICYQRRSSKQFELIYQQKVPDKNLWSNEIILHASINSFDNASLLFINNKITVYWVKEDIIYYSSSEDNGNTWSKASRYQFQAGRQLMCICYKSNASGEAENVIAPLIPGNFINGFNLAFYQPSRAYDTDLSAEDLRAIILDGIKLLKSRVEELKESDNDIYDNITRLSAFQQNIERETVKFSLKYNMLENEINQLKQSYSKLDRFNEILTDLRSKIEAESTANDVEAPAAPSQIRNAEAAKEIYETKKMPANSPEPLKKLHPLKTFKLKKI